MSLIDDAQRITEYRIPKNKLEVKEEENSHILRVENEKLLDEKHETSELPNTVNCPSCEAQTAEQDEDDQLYVCTECGRETVRTQ